MVDTIEAFPPSLPRDRLLPATVSVLIQDTHTLVRECLRMLVDSFDGLSVIASVPTLDDALAVAAASKPDIIMLELTPDCFPILRSIVRRVPDAAVICLADNPTNRTIRLALDAGAAGIALKSGSPEELMRALQGVRRGEVTVAPEIAGPLLEHYHRIVQEKRRRDGSIIQALAAAVDAKDSLTGEHIHRVAAIATALAIEVDPGPAANEELRYGFILHDVGKIGIPESILIKPGPLTSSEWEVMRTHPLIGLQIISPVGLGEEAESVVRNHHERWDGKGYPDGLRKDEIPLGARVFAVADTFDSMTNDRSYRKALPVYTAVEEIRTNAGIQFDPGVVAGFMELATSGRLAPV